MKELLKYAKQSIIAHPEFKSEIEDLVQLCKDEIEQGGSADHEIDLCTEDIRQLFEEEED